MSTRPSNDAQPCATPDNREVSGLANSEWVMVPREPTPKMIDATFNDPIETNGEPESHNRRNKRVFKAMIAAAPTPPKAEPVAFLVTGGRTFKDKVFLVRANAEESVRTRNDGARVAELYTAQPAPTTISPAASAVEKVAQALKQEDVGRDTLWQAAYMLRNYATELRASSEPTPDVIRDAERYRFIRDTPWFGVGSPLERVIAQQRNAHWDESIDAAIREQQSEEKDND